MKSAASSPLPAPGTTFAVPLADGRFTLARVLALDGQDAALVAVTAWIGSPADLSGALQDPRARQILILTHHDWRGVPQVLWVGGPPPESWRPLGVLDVLPGEIRETATHANWDAAEFHALVQWRWDHEREKLLAEEAQKSRAKMRLRLRAAKRRLPTIPALKRKRWFRTWDTALGAAAKRILHDAIDDLGHGVQPKEPEAVIAGIRGCVEALNRLSLESGGAIGTTEREELVEALLLMGLAAGVDETRVEPVVDATRTW